MILIVVLVLITQYFGFKHVNKSKRQIQIYKYTNIKSVVLKHYRLFIRAAYPSTTGRWLSTKKLANVLRSALNHVPLEPERAHTVESGSDLYWKFNTFKKCK